MKIIDKTTFKFILVGVINTGIGTLVMMVLYNLFHVNYWISSAMNYVIGSLVSFFMNKHYTFQNKEKSIKQVIRFVFNIIICYLLAYGIARPLVKFILSESVIIIQENIAMLTGVCIFVILNYVGQRFIVFKIDEK